MWVDKPDTGRCCVMDWKSIAANVSVVAPGIGAAIGGPAGSVVGLGVKALCNFFGVDSTSKDAAAQVEAAVNNMTPEQAVALKKNDQDFQVSMEEIGVKVFAMEVEDRDSARNREKEVGSRETAILAYMAVLSFVAVVGIVLWAILFGKGMEAIGVLGGSLIGSIVTLLSQKVEQVFGYFFGSSKGSQSKTNTLSNGLASALSGKK